MAGADIIIGVDLIDDKAEMASNFGMKHLVNPSKVENAVQAIFNMPKRDADQIGSVE